MAKAKDPFISVMGLVIFNPKLLEFTVNGSEADRVSELLEFTTKGARRSKPRFPPPSKLRGATVAKPNCEASTVMGGAVTKLKLSFVVVNGAIVLSVRALALTDNGALQESVRPCEVWARGSSTLVLVVVS